jgi:hypothetical protein
MDMKGAEPTDTILTLEDALRQFARKRSQAGIKMVDEAQVGPNLQFVHLAPVKQAGEETPAGDPKPADESAPVAIAAAEVAAASPAGEDLVAMVDGLPRNLDELEGIAAAEKAYREDFPDGLLANAEYSEAEEFDDVEPLALAFATQDTRRHDYAFTAMGTALMALVVVLMTRVPIVDNHRPNFPNLVAQIFPKPALNAPTPQKSADDVVTTMVIIPDADVQIASAKPAPKSDQLEAQIKDTLKSRAWPDIGVSVSKKGEAFLAGEVYSLDEANKIAEIVHKVNGVHHVHFLHPDVRLAQGPAFFGATTAWAPDVWGARVRAVSIGSPADKAGLQKGDVISEFDGKTIPDAKSFHDLMAQYSPGQRVQLRVWHNGQPEYLVARLGDQQTVASR